MSSSTASAATKKRKRTETGAPAQKTQSTRKGKRAWRKNVDLQDIEAGIESLREEEIVTGGKLQDRSDKDLFQIDTTGDEFERKRLQKEKKPLRFMQVLSQRSAVPAIHSKPSSSKPAPTGKAKITSAEKTRLLQKARRLQKGAFNSYLDPTEAGSAVDEPRVTGEYNVWEDPDSDDEALAKVITTEEAAEYIQKLIEKPKVKAPASLLPSRDIERDAVDLPHAGLSYNPSYDAHQELLKTAHAIEIQRETQVEKFREKKAQMEAMKHIQPDEEDVKTRFKGMAIDQPADEAAEDVVAGSSQLVEEKESTSAVKANIRKTRSQKLKAARLHAEKRLLAEKAARKRLAASIDAVKSLARSTNRELSSREALLAAQKATAEAERRKPIVGKKIGKHVVKPGEIDVQLSEELSESLRGLQPEGNLFKDRFLSLQQRSLVEPRQRVMPTKRRTKFKEYEKHPWKRFT